MSWPEIDLVVGQSPTDHDLRCLRDDAAAGAAALASADSRGCDVVVSGFEDAQRASPTFQEQANWCWAACVQAVLRHYGVHREQHAIVSDVYGAPLDLPELSPAQLYHVVNGQMTLADGTTCLVRGRHYPGGLLTPPVLYNELLANHPVMAVHDTGDGTGHAVVIYGATFSPFGVTSVKYFDPTPGQGLAEVRGLVLGEVVRRWFAIRGAARACA
jgi:hypothetical protein